jgi:transcriptional regulator with XRE-family HTH domain
MLENSPMRELRQELGLSMREFAQALGCSYAALSACELGHYTGIPSTWRDSLESLGEDYESLHEAQRAWRRRQGANAAAGGR